MPRLQQTEPPPLRVLRSIPFVTGLQYTPGATARLTLRTPSTRSRHPVISNRSLLTRAEAALLLNWSQQLDPAAPGKPVLLARHVSRPVANLLIEAGMNFADDSGNVHLRLGDHYNWTVLGNPAPSLPHGKRPVSAAQLQLLFSFASTPESLHWSVRQLEALSGVSKSRAASARAEMAANGLLARRGERFLLGPHQRITDNLLLGYSQILRPRLLIGTFRPPDKTTSAFLERLREAPPPGIRFALTGAPAADRLQHLYHSPDAALFVSAPAEAAARQLRLLPDRNGPVSLLSAFGDLVFWQPHDGLTLAPPWLIYAELLASNDPRSREAAAALHRQFLSTPHAHH